MKKRLTKIYTRTGDRGETGLGDGSRLPKNNPRIESIGEIDELNAIIGMLATHTLPETFVSIVNTIQNDLFDLGSDLSVPQRNRVNSGYTEWLEKTLDRLNNDLPPLKEFILPGGSPAAAACHHARTVCRRAERGMVSLVQQGDKADEVMKYLNRLSDLLFVMARILARTDSEEILWKPGNRGTLS